MCQQLIQERLRKLNVLVCPDWTQPEEDLLPELMAQLKAVVNYPHGRDLLILVSSEGTSRYLAELALCEILFQLMLDIQIDNESSCPDIVLLNPFEPYQWNILLPHLNGRLNLAREKLPNPALSTLPQLQNLPLMHQYD